jgi:hypothetical protein
MVPLATFMGILGMSGSSPESLEESASEAWEDMIRKERDE